MRRRLLVLIAAASALAVLTAYGEGSHAEDRAETVTYYGSFAGYDLPMKPIEEISKEEALSRDTYCLAYYDDGGRLIRFEKYLKHQLFFRHNYDYDENGRLKEMRGRNADGVETVWHFDEDGEPISRQRDEPQL